MHCDAQKNKISDYFNERIIFWCYATETMELSSMPIIFHIAAPKLSILMKEKNKPDKISTK